MNKEQLIYIIFLFVVTLVIVYDPLLVFMAVIGLAFIVFGIGVFSIFYRIYTELGD